MSKPAFVVSRACIAPPQRILPVTHKQRDSQQSMERQANPYSATGLVPCVDAELVNAFDLLIFDFDGTLCHTQPSIAHSVKRTFDTLFDFLPDDDLIAAVINSGLPLDQTFITLDRRLRGDNKALQTAITAYRSFYASESEQFSFSFEGTRDTLEQVSSVGIRCVVISNKGIDAVRRSLLRDELSPFVDLVLGDEPNVPKKPSSALLEKHVLSRYPDTDRSRILMIGDTDIDIQFAKNSNIRSCWATYGYGNAEKCSALNPDYSISRIDQVLQYIQRGPNAASSSPFRSAA
jgi:phosphoglycolate phosphatase